jgi:hypothetical protein
MANCTLRNLLIGLTVVAAIAVWHFGGLRDVAQTQPTDGVEYSSSESDVTVETPPAPTPPPATLAATASSTSAVVAFHELPVDVPLLALAQHAGDPATLQSFRVRLGADRFADIDVARFDALNDDEGVYSGSVRGERDSQAVFSYVGLAHAGTVVLPDEERAFYITATEGGRMRITELDLTRAPLCGQPLLPQHASAAGGFAGALNLFPP